jgi:hypothetical protein
LNTKARATPCVSQLRTDDATHCRLLIGKHPIQSVSKDQMSNSIRFYPARRTKC